MYDAEKNPSEFFLLPINRYPDDLALFKRLLNYIYDKVIKRRSGMTTDFEYYFDSAWSKNLNDCPNGFIHIESFLKSYDILGRFYPGTREVIDLKLSVYGY